MGPGTATAWQHDAAPLGARHAQRLRQRRPAVDAAALARRSCCAIDPRHGPPRSSRASRSRRRSSPRPRAISSAFPTATGGSAGATSTSPPRSAPAARLLFEAHTPAGSESYRTLRFPWSGRAATRPRSRVRAARRRRLDVYASWNGATAVARWRLEAGASPARCTRSARSRETGFETALRAPGSAAVRRGHRARRRRARAGALAGALHALIAVRPGRPAGHRRSSRTRCPAARRASDDRPSCPFLLDRPGACPEV